ncbi:MAG: hypothetical protein FJ143_16990 [Deltaproteobacteria bacterium]|nr:hypothetical protein [Deltaproteobacteria bacterium]
MGTIVTLLFFLFLATGAAQSSDSTPYRPLSQADQMHDLIGEPVNLDNDGRSFKRIVGECGGHPAVRYADQRQNCQLIESWQDSPLMFKLYQVLLI